MNNSKFYPIVCLVMGLLIVAAGVLTLTAGMVVLEAACYLIGAVAILHGVFLFLSTLAKRKKLSKSAMGSVYITAVYNVIVGVMAVFMPRLNLIPVLLIYTVYVFVNAAINLVDYIIDRRDNVPGRYREFLNFLAFTVFGILLIFVPEMGKNGFTVVVGIYAIVYGAFQLWDFLFQCLPSSVKNHITGKLSLPLPVVISTLLPFLNLKSREMKNILDPQKAEDGLKPYFPIGKETDAPPDMEVMIHVSSRGHGIMGHCDIAFEGRIYSYASYDLTSVALFGVIGDGIFLKGEKEPYVRFYVSSSPREILGYGFRLSDLQKQAVREEIAEIEKMIYPWETPLQQLAKNDPAAKGEDVCDWGSKLWNCSGADFYKFKSGKLKTYFVVTSNCVMLADRIIRKACSDNIINATSVLTPGSYYDYLEHLLAMPDSPVFCRTLYNKDSTRSWSYTPRIPYSSPEMEVMTEAEANRRASEKLAKRNAKRRNKVSDNPQ
ncbi:MAG: DUF308 domain-containing protein [Firmicutes bacterium]|nr:DUF308 domain-containing protein [[Eubacterium] siraeum]MCM1487166.1 DUF308 domain-containing protein [Bacillota bacterium]